MKSSRDGKTAKGIFSLEGDVLRIRYGQKGAARPASFDDQDPTHMQWVLERVKP